MRCFGDLGRLEREGIRVERLLGGYGIITVPETLIPLVAAMPEIEYVEKPNRLFFAADRGRAASCTASVQTGPDGLTGKGVLVGVIDSGIDYAHPDFRNEDGTTRILELWDQSLGRVFTRDHLLNRIWGYDYFGDEKIVNTHIKNIRKKLGADYIETIRGVGYKIEKENP